MLNMATKHPKTTTSTGEVIGTSAKGIDRYLGIPFAAPPFGENRFKLPQPPAAWSEPLEATAFGPTSPQTPYPGRIGTLLSSIDIPGENILTVNVWTPADAQDLPVVLWIHGGAYERGGAAIESYDGTPFARDGVVFVSCNYRLGGEGFSVLDGAPRNLALEDVAAALRWVRDEIANFGGDPSRITIMGESAGASLVAALLSRPDCDFIAGAIMESGPLDARPVEKVKVTGILAKKLGVPATRDGFASVTPAQLLRARTEQMEGKSILDGVPSFVLVLDEQSLPVHPVEGVREASVPLLIGTNSHEHSLWYSPEVEAKTSAFKLWLVTKVLGVPKAAVKATKAANPGASPGAILGQLLTESLFRAPAVKAARTRKAPTYLYEFQWETPKDNLRATHALEIGFVFDALPDPEHEMMIVNGPQPLADRMHADWVRFIKEQRVSWPAFGEAGEVRLYNTEDSLGGVSTPAVINALIGS